MPTAVQLPLPLWQVPLQERGLRPGGVSSVQEVYGQVAGVGGGGGDGGGVSEALAWLEGSRPLALPLPQAHLHLGPTGLAGAGAAPLGCSPSVFCGPSL